MASMLNYAKTAVYFLKRGRDDATYTTDKLVARLVAAGHRNFAIVKLGEREGGGGGGGEEDDADDCGGGGEYLLIAHSFDQNDRRRQEHRRRRRRRHDDDDHETVLLPLSRSKSIQLNGRRRHNSTTTRRTTTEIHFSTKLSCSPPPPPPPRLRGNHLRLTNLARFGGGKNITKDNDDEEDEDEEEEEAAALFVTRRDLDEFYWTLFAVAASRYYLDVYTHSRLFEALSIQTIRAPDFFFFDDILYYALQRYRSGEKEEVEVEYDVEEEGEGEEDRRHRKRTRRDQTEQFRQMIRYWYDKSHSATAAAVDSILTYSRRLPIRRTAEEEEEEPRFDQFRVVRTDNGRAFDGVSATDDENEKRRRGGRGGGGGGDHDDNDDDDDCQRRGGGGGGRDPVYVYRICDSVVVGDELYLARIMYFLFLVDGIFQNMTARVRPSRSNTE